VSLKKNDKNAPEFHLYRGFFAQRKEGIETSAIPVAALAVPHSGHCRGFPVEWFIK
jgi:hypothetical protein